MAWTTPVTVAPGDAILASLWNEQVRDNSAAIRDAQVNVQQTFLTTTVAFVNQSSDSFSEITGIACSITPSSTTSRILVIANAVVSATSGGQAARLRLYRNGSHLTAASSSAATGNRRAAWTMGCGDNANTQQSITGIYLDSPSSVASQTYTIYGGHSRATADTWYVNRILTDSDAVSTTLTTSSLTLIEVPA